MKKEKNKKQDKCWLHDSPLYKCEHSKCKMVHCKFCDVYPCGSKAKTFIFKTRKKK